MIVTGIFLFLLGTKVSKISAVQTDVTYQPSRISIREQIDQTPAIIKESGPSHIVHQGSNYFFGSPFPKPLLIPQPSPPRKVEVIEEDIIFSKSPVFSRTPAEVELEERMLHTNPLLAVNEKDLFRYPKLPMPLTNIQGEAVVVPLSFPFSPQFNTEFITNLPLDFYNNPFLSTLIKRPVVPSKEGIIVPPREGVIVPPREGIIVPPRAGVIVPPREGVIVPPREGIIVPPREGVIVPPREGVIVPPREGIIVPPREGVIVPPREGIIVPSREGIVVTSKDCYGAGVDVVVKKIIPPPPQLPPLRLDKIFPSIVVGERKIILVPAPPKVEAIVPPTLIRPGFRCLPSLCAREIVFERVLPNIACEKSKKVEIVSIPAAMGPPVVTSSFLPMILKK